MKLPDTCIWIEALAGTATGQRYYALLRQTSTLVVPTLVQYELRRWCLRALRDGMAEDVADRAIASTRAARIIALDEPTALYAAELAQLHGLASADALIYASALREQAELVTCDAHFKACPVSTTRPNLRGEDRRCRRLGCIWKYWQPISGFTLGILRISGLENNIVRWRRGKSRKIERSFVLFYVKFIDVRFRILPNVCTSQRTPAQA